MAEQKFAELELSLLQSPETHLIILYHPSVIESELLMSSFRFAVIQDVSKLFRMILTTNSCASLTYRLPYTPPTYF